MSQYYDAQVVLDNEGVWADPVQLPVDELMMRKTWRTGELHTLEDAGVELDENDKPINPYDKNNAKLGRHMLGKWGPNHAADPIVTRESNGVCGLFRTAFPMEVLMIKRKPMTSDSLEKLSALPGGMVDPGEGFKTAALRECFEEAVNRDTDFEKRFLKDAARIYSGYAADPRCTRNAWIETCTFHVHLTNEESDTLGLKTYGDGVETSAAFWMPVTHDTLDAMFSHHPLRIKEAFALKGWTIARTRASHTVNVITKCVLPYLVAATVICLSSLKQV
jgi:ADP-ribose pyrophosphatase